MHNTLSIFCITAIVLFISLECIISYNIHAINACSYKTAEFSGLHNVVNYAVLGGFMSILAILLLKLLLTNFDKRCIPMVVTTCIVTISTCTCFCIVSLSPVYCVDTLGVASSPYIWGEWISCSPLIIYSVIIITNETLTNMDMFVIASFTFSVICGFLIIFAQSQSAAEFLLVLSILSYMPIHYLLIHNPNVSNSLINKSLSSEAQASLNQELFAIQKILSVFLCSIFPFYTIVYLCGLTQRFSHETTIASYNILSLLTKGIYVEICSDHYMLLITKVEDILQEEERHNKARREFIRYVFHEVRNPINTISIGIDLLQETKTMENHDREHLDLMKEAVHNISEILDSVITVQKIEEGKLTLNWDYYDIREIMRNAYNILRSPLDQKQINIRFMFCHNIPKIIYIDGPRIEHVIISLLGNAIKYSPEKGKIAVTTVFEFKNKVASDAMHSFLPYKLLYRMHRKIRPTTETIATDTDIYIMNISITDNGPGMSNVVKESLYVTTTTPSGGKVEADMDRSRLGLTFCKTIVSLHGGVMHVNSLEGYGTTFKILIPITKHKYYAYDKHSDSVHTPFSTKTNNKHHPRIQPTDEFEDQPRAEILIVDDSAMNRKMLKQMLLLFDVYANEVENGEKAVIEIAKNETSYKIVFMDNYMPVMNGLIASNQLRKLHYDKIIIGLTGNTLPTDMKEFLAAGVNYVIKKPISKDHIEKLIRFMKDDSNGCCIGTVQLMETDTGFVLEDSV